MTALKRGATFVVLTLATMLALAMVAAIVYRPDRAIRVGVGMTAQTLCGDLFVTGLDQARALHEDIEPQGGMRLLLKRMHFDVDKQARQITVDWAGHFTTVARYEDGRGCTLGTVVEPISSPSPAPASISDSTIIPGSPAIQAALDHAFDEPTQPPYRRVRAIVILRNGKIIGERYAPGIGPDTPLLAYSVSKSVINALVGILVREGKLDVSARAPVAAWNGPDDPRRAITLDQLLRMTSGLDLSESDSGFDPVSRMLFLEPDMAAFAERAKLKAKPGTQFEYTSGNTLIASAIVRDQIGGHANDVWRFAQHELFDPVGMQHVTMEFDHAGTPIGSTRFFASARDWARFGQLYLDDGVVNGRRLLPQGWIAYSTRPTLDSDYGSGFWLNAGDAENARFRVKAGMPVDTFYASGNFGQRIVVIPSQRMVIVRFGTTVDPSTFDIRGLIRLVNEVIAAK